MVEKEILWEDHNYKNLFIKKSRLNRDFLFLKLKENYPSNSACLLALFSLINSIIAPPNQ